MRQEVALGYAIPISRDCVRNLKHGELYPLGLAHQLTINDQGLQIPKKRVTHDLSNRKKHGLSINQRVIDEELPACQYGHAILRFLHLVHHIRLQHPNQRILMCKSDIDKAYRRLHTTPRIAAKCMTAWSTNIDKDETQQEAFIGLLLTRLPFGSSPAPAEFSICSDTIFDLANDLLHCTLWDPTALPSPYDADLPAPEHLPNDTPFGDALPVDVHLPPSQKAGVEGYIDDGIVAVLDAPITKRMVERARQALAMANHLVFRPQAHDEPITRPDAQCIRKLKAEGRLQETIIFLGWHINSRSLTICLPDDKAIAWTTSIQTALKDGSISYDDASTLVGRLNHVAFTIPSARHFLNRIRRLEYIADKYGTAKINPQTRCDLKLWLDFIHQANTGLSINSIVFRLPTIICFSDASEHGIGGYCLNTGLAWHYQFSRIERESFTLNLKEFLASVINGKVHLPLDKSPHPCLLSVGDSSCAAGWLNKSNFDPTLEPIHADVAREHARTIIKHNACEYSQHIPGVTNVVADCLSRDFHLSHKHLTAMLKSANPPYLPQVLTYTPLSQQILSWIGSLARNQPKRKVSPKQPTPSTLAHGISGWTSNATSNFPTPIWTTKTKPPSWTSSVLSCKQYALEHLTQNPSEFLGPLRVRPSAMWRRPLLQVVGLIQRKTLSEKRTSASSDKQKHTERKTLQLNTKRHYLPQYSGTSSPSLIPPEKKPRPTSSPEPSSMVAEAANIVSSQRKNAKPDPSE